ncbi:chemotaxis protein CheA [Candidatus Woesearchaeota archaeon]|nr:chemotaxis protein CheA [Candidatus Woesearchaeota archaeon]
MDTKQYKEEFLQEANEHIDRLNELFLNLEKNASDFEIINEIFRSFHTLKGSSSSMGYSKFSELAHSMEDVLEKIREHELVITSEIIDTLLEGTDMLEGALKSIESDDMDNIDIHEINKELKEIIGIHIQRKNSVNVEEHAIINDDQRSIIKQEEEEGFMVYRIIIHFDISLKQPQLKAMLIIRNLSNVGKIILTYPARDDLYSKLGHEFEVILSTDKNTAEIEKLIDKLLGIKEISFLSVDEKYKRKDREIEFEEERLKRKAKKSDVVKKIQSVKIDIKRLDNLMNLVGELLINKIRLQEVVREHNLKELDTLLAAIDRLTLDIQDEVMKERMIPIGNVFNRFPRMVRDLAKKEGKEINLIIEGQEIEFDRTILDQVGEPIVHLLRNSVDHGIESPEERQKNNKDSTGNIKLVASREKNHAVISVSDDGKGIDPDKVYQSAMQKGLVENDDDKLTYHDKLRLIFTPGLSTRDKISEISGRGVGMDVVENKVRALGGTVKINSKVNEGTQITMQLPLTLAIISSLLVRVGSDTFALPLSTVNSALSSRKLNIKTIQGNEVFIFRNKEIPLIKLQELFNIEGDNNENGTIIIVDKEDNQIGILVDEIISQQQILVKNIDNVINDIKGLSGATILGNGRVALILDTESLAG